MQIDEEYSTLVMCVTIFTVTEREEQFNSIQHSKTKRKEIFFILI